MQEGKFTRLWMLIPLIILTLGITLFLRPDMAGWLVTGLISVTKALTGLYLLYWGSRWLTHTRTHLIEDEAQRHQRELALIVAAGLVIAGAW